MLEVEGKNVSGPGDINCFIYLFIYFCNVFFFNWDSLHARLNTHYEACSYKNGSTKKITGYRKSP